MGAPLATVAAFNAVNQQFVCGAGAGVAVSFLACPTELIKC
ncbi:mitochondrial carnitine/acylcarnitine carrier-like protein, partial [Trifolium pratense]